MSLSCSGTRSASAQGQVQTASSEFRGSPRQIRRRPWLCAGKAGLQTCAPAAHKNERQPCLPVWSLVSLATLETGLAPQTATHRSAALRSARDRAPQSGLYAHSSAATDRDSVAILTAAPKLAPPA